MTVAMRWAWGAAALLAADAGDPLHLNAAGCGRVEVFAVGQLGRANGVEHDVLALVVDGGGLVGADHGEFVR